MSSFSYHEPCPKCGSKDNLGVWDDGHKWCFGCGYYVPSVNTLESVEIFAKEKDETHLSNTDICLPSDHNSIIPAQPYSWIKQYEISNREIEEACIQWSNNEEMLLFPFYGEKDQLLCWQGRYFPARVPKVFTRGYPDRHLLLYSCANPINNGNTLVVCEDCISAIKVSRFVDCAPLLGAYLSLEKAIRFSRYYSELILWLDPDKAKEMMKFVGRYKHLYEVCRFIISERDPKEHSNDEIKEYLK